MAYEATPYTSDNYDYDDAMPSHYLEQAMRDSNRIGQMIGHRLVADGDLIVVESFTY